MLVPGMPELPKKILIAGDSECMIPLVETKETILKPFFTNRVSEILKHFCDYESKGMKVEPLHHVPGEENPANLATQGQAEE